MALSSTHQLPLFAWLALSFLRTSGGRLLQAFGDLAEVVDAHDSLVVEVLHDWVSQWSPILPILEVVVKVRRVGGNDLPLHSVLIAIEGMDFQFYIGHRLLRSGNNSETMLRWSIAGERMLQASQYSEYSKTRRLFSSSRITLDSKLAPVRR